ncbi:MAG: uracil-DNA glycosylase [Microgenomates group bacterium Gr01-1014_16]|nr:MAG: uracil-DNA glycosylase [Microgenomates group bacterium Gr01-1014_16]
MKRAIFIGQAMPRFKKDPHDWPTLNTWLYSIGICHEEIVRNFFYSALVDYFPGSKNGSHLVPTAEEITKERIRLIKTIENFSPDIVVPIGKLSISHCLSQQIGLAEVIGKKFVADPYGALGYGLNIIPLPHPSGASTWHRKPKNKILLNRALDVLKSNLNL